jgi:glyoxylase-like metal-dependent hydrolase (beta-lactamase superfamily II)
MKRSINKLKKYNDIIIYPGHGRITSLEEEKNNNIYFR